MRRLKNPRIERETLEEQNKAGRYNPGFVLVYRHRRIYLGVGRSDLVTVFKEAAHVYVLAVNPAYGYAGLNVYVIEDKSETTSGWSEAGEVFFQNDWDLPEGFFDWRESKMLAHLIEHT
jgi:hypothetical protein